jgi:hypothetical protein
MVKSDVTNRYNGLIQRCEDICGLGATGITSNATLYSQFIGWLNQWNTMAAHWAIMSWDGADFDDIGYTTQPHGTFVGTTNRDYNFDQSYMLLKIKLVQVTYNGVNWVVASPFDASDPVSSPGDDFNPDIGLSALVATHDPNADSQFDMNAPKFDLRANGFDLYPKFTAAQVAAGASIYAEFDRGPRLFDTTSGTDLYQSCLDLQFQHFPSIGASFLSTANYINKT